MWKEDDLGFYVFVYSCLQFKFPSRIEVNQRIFSAKLT